MSIKLNQIFKPAVDALTGKKAKSTKKTFRYRVIFKGATLSRHYTKKAAVDAAKKVRGARWAKIASKRKSTRKYRG